ncbi:MAG: TonB-dependent receptor [Dokdonella sp.]
MKHLTTIASAMPRRTATLLRRRPLAAIIAGSLAMLAAPGAFAQQTNVSTASGTDATQLDVIVVTANKRKENVRKVPSSISVLNDAQLERINATQLSDYANYIPGFQLNSGGTPGQTTVTLRGIAALSSGSTVGTYLDETPVGSSGIYQAATLFALDLLPYDIDRIEVLRGPQGTLYGAGAMGGLVKYVTRQPDLNNTELRAGGGLSGISGGGSGNNFRFGANVPLVQDSLGIRASYSRNNLPGYIDNTINGKKDINDGSQTSGRIALLWKNDDVSLNVAAMRQTIDSDNNATVNLRTDAEKPLLGDLKNAVYVNEPFKKDIDYYAATLDWDLGWGTFTSASGYSDTTTRRRSDSTIDYGNFTNLALGLPDPGSSYFNVGLDLTKFTQEFRLASSDQNAFEWMLGAFYTRESGNQSQGIYLNQLDGSPLPAAAAGFSTLAYLELPTTYKEKALFANGSYKFTDRFKLSAGVRYAQNDQKFSQNVLAGALLPIANQPGASSENVSTFSLSPQFQLTDDNLLYFKVATGYQPGGPNVSFPGLPSKVDSSTLTSYEGGLKALFADRRVQVDLAVFHINWKDIQVPTVFEGKSGLVNGGAAKTDGLELAAVYRPDASLQLGFNAAYTKAQLGEDYKTIVNPGAGGSVSVITGGLSGDRLPYIPRFSWSATADYFFPLGSWEGNLGGGIRWTGDRVTGTTSRTVRTTGATPPVTTTTVTSPNSIDSYYALDLYAGMAKDRWSIRGYVKNATDQRGYSSLGNNLNQVTGVTGSRSGTPILPRTFGVEFDYRF